MPAEAAVADCIVIRDSGSIPKPRRVMAQELVEFPGYVPLCPDISDKENQVVGLQQRLGRDIPKSCPEFLSEFGVFVAEWLRSTFAPLTQLLTFDEWLESTSYNTHRKEQLRKLWNLVQDPSSLPKKLRRKIASFIKSESYGAFKFPRWINSRSDWFKVISGPLFKSIEQEVYESHWFIKHVPVPERRAKIQGLKAAGRQYFQTDYKAFESHFTPEFMAVCECQLYTFMASLTDPALVKSVCATLCGENHGATRAGVCFQLKGRRMSGDMCTSLGNGFTNLMLWLYIAKKLGFETDGFVEGDDGIFATWGRQTTSKEIALLAKFMGFTIDINEYDDPGKASFCGILCADDAIIKDPRDVLENFGWSYSHIGASDRVQKQLLRAKALSLMYELPDCPIVGAISRHFIRMTEGYTARFVDDGYHKAPPPFSPAPMNVSAKTRLLFSDLFGVSPAVQIQIENVFDTKPTTDACSFVVACLPPKPCHDLMKSLYKFKT